MKIPIDGKPRICSHSQTSAKIIFKNLYNHLIRKHDINLLKRVKDDDDEGAHRSNIISITSVTNDTNSRSKISDYFNITKTIDDSFPAVLAWLTARDCLSFKKICTSYDLQQLFKFKGYDCQKSPKTIKNCVVVWGQNLPTNRYRIIRKNSPRWKWKLEILWGRAQ